mgnify:FL=1
MAFLGISEFKHFVGVVEDRFDPEKLGRLRVRVLGVHTSDKNKIATADLPWASVVLPTTSAGISGLGQSPSFIVEGAWVWGYFRDGDKLMQEMVIVGTLPGKPAELGNTDSGFYDPNFRLAARGVKTKISVYPRYADEPDTNRLAVNNPEKEAPSFSNRKRTRITGVPVAAFDGLFNIEETSFIETQQEKDIGLIDVDYTGLERYSGEGGGALLHNDADAIEALLYAPTLNNEEDAFRNLLIRKYNITIDTDIGALTSEIRQRIRGVIANEATDAEKWNQPEITYNAIYPYNHVFESESGHIKEYDDTPLHERIFERHTSGTSYEFTPNGDRVDIIKNNHYTLTSSDNKAYIQGDSDVTIDGRHKVFINKSGMSNNHYDIEVGPNANVNIQVDKGNLNVVTKTGQFNFDVGADWNMNVGGNYNLNVVGNETKTVEGTTTHNTTGSTTIRGSTIDLNP